MTAFDLVWKAFRYPEYWHGTTAANAKKILEEGFEPHSFGSPHDEDAISYAWDRMVDNHPESEGPALLGFSTDENTQVLDPWDHGYDFGTEEYGHIMMGNRLDPKNIQLFAMGNKSMTEMEWWDFVQMLQRNDRLSGNRYPDIGEAYANRWRRLFE
jgi:hypothetical protein